MNRREIPPKTVAGKAMHPCSGAQRGARTLDSLHVACAMELKANRFWTFDERQAKLAKAAGLRTT